MYHGAARDREDKKRQRLTPNEVWMEVLMNKGKTPDGYIPASAVAASGVATATSSASAGWQGRTRDWDQAAPSQGPMQYQQYSSSSSSSAGYPGRTVERPPPSYQGRTMTDSAAGYQRRSAAMDAAGYQGRTMNGGANYPARSMEAAARYQGRAMGNSTAYQGRAMEGSSAAYQGRTMQAPTGYQGRTMEAPPGYQGRTVDAAAAGGYQGRPVQVPAGYQRVMDGSAGKMYQGRPMEGSSSGKMAEDYKRERKLPPRVEEMLREQVNMDDSVMYDAFAVAMEDLIPEQEANFVAKGLCHLCGVNENHFVPVVNFCPHADENHSLCREHLRSVYRVRMEALFVGRNGSAPNRRLLRCLICTRGCPCTGCTAEKENDVQKYRRYLMDTLRRSGQGSGSAMRDGRAAAAAAPPVTTVATPTTEGRLTYGSAQNVGGSDGRRYSQYPRTPPAEGRPPIQRDGFSARNIEASKMYGGRRQVASQQSEYEQYPVGERNSRDGYSPSMQAQQKSPSQYPPVPKRAAKDTPADTFSAVAENAPTATDSRVAAARAASPQVHQGAAESPSAATVMNCAESEKSLVQLLNSLNQGGAPATSVAMDASSQSSKDGSYRPSESRYNTDGNAATNGSSGNEQDTGDTEMEASPRVHPDRGIADQRRQSDASYQDQSPTSSMDSGDESTPRKDSNADARSGEELQSRKRKISESDDEDSPAPRDSGVLSSRDDSRAAHRDESLAKEQSNEDQRKHQFETSTKLSSKSDGIEAESTPNTDKKESHVTQPPPPPPHRGPGRPRKIHTDTAAASKSSQERKTIQPVKRGKGRPPKHAKPPKPINEDEETEDEVYKEEDDEDYEDEEEGGSESELDTNLDFCEVCQGAGDLVCCDKCPRSFHLKCLHMTENDLPEGDWQCAECKKPSRFEGYSVAVAAEQNLLDKCLKIVQCLKSHPFSKPFLTPVENVPMYTRVVKQPMDLSRIENKLKKGAYIVDSNTVAAGVKELDTTHFANDIRLMWSNCKLFNDDGSGITRAADILSAGFERLYKESIAPPLTS